MMSDRELFELAAKAAGAVPSLDLSGEPKGTYKHPPEPGIIRAHTSGWNPLTDDGAALRLAIQFGMEIYHTYDDGCFAYASYKATNRITRYAVEPHGTDSYAATRRAIVRVAADIGRKE